jgi:prepilin peptidase CpaA
MGAMGAGDAKFIAAAAPFVHPGDIRLVIAVFAAALLAAFATHRLIRHSPLRRLAPDWQSWQSGARFPLGFALGGTLAAYLLLGAKFGG